MRLQCDSGCYQGRWRATRNLYRRSQSGVSNGYDGIFIRARLQALPEEKEYRALYILILCVALFLDNRPCYSKF